MQQQEKREKKKKRIRLDRAAEPSRTTESLQHLITPNTHPPPLPAPPSTSICKTKMQKEEEASPQVELCTDAPGSSQLMQGALCCAERCCFCIQ